MAPKGVRGHFCVPYAPATLNIRVGGAVPGRASRQPNPGHGPLREDDFDLAGLEDALRHTARNATYVCWMPLVTS